MLLLLLPLCFSQETRFKRLAFVYYFVVDHYENYGFCCSLKAFQNPYCFSLRTKKQSFAFFRNVDCRIIYDKRGIAEECGLWRDSKVKHVYKLRITEMKLLKFTRNHRFFPKWNWWLDCCSLEYIQASCYWMIFLSYYKNRICKLWFETWNITLLL